jgi:hypothetical protein
MTRTEIEDAINQLTYLLYKEEFAEEKYQEYFEQNPCVFKILGYSNAYPRLRLPRSGGGWYEPDFLLKRSSDDLFEILDLKTPQEKLIPTRKKYRKRFYAKIEDYISQVEEYAEYFNDSESRNKVKDIHTLDIQASPEITIVVGTDKDVDKKQLHQLLSRRTHRPHIYTYDDILSSLQFYHATLFGHTENISGVAWYGLLTPHRVNTQKPKYVFDAGNDPAKNRWSIYLDEHNALHFEIFDSEGSSYSISVRHSTHGLNFESQCHVICEFGNSDNFSIMRILINNRTAAEQQFQFPISIPSDLDFTIGTDIEKKYFGSFTLAAVAIYKIVPTFRQRAAIFQAMLEL